MVRQMSALLVHDLQRIMSSMDEALQLARQTEPDPRGLRKVMLLDLRDRALLLVGFATALRREELAGIGLEHTVRDDNGIIITPPHTKTDQTGSRRTPRPVPRGTHISTCPVTALDRWLAAAEITTGPIFRPVSRWGTIGAKAFTGQVVRTIVRDRAAAAGLPGSWGAHSLRAGFATQSARNGVPRHAIMAGGDWNSSASTATSASERSGTSPLPPSSVCERTKVDLTTSNRRSTSRHQRCEIGAVKWGQRSGEVTTTASASRPMRQFPAPSKAQSPRIAPEGCALRGWL